MVVEVGWILGGRFFVGFCVFFLLMGMGFWGGFICYLRVVGCEVGESFVV